MKHVFTLYSITLLFLLGMSSEVILGKAAVATMPAISSDSMIGSEPVGKAHATASTVSVHEMFKDVPQEELLQMMEEGQQFIKYLEEHGTPEEKMAFAQAMEETLQGFTEDDWKEFEAIVETVQDKLPPLEVTPKEEPKPVVKEETKKEEPKPVVIDNSLEKILHAIHKAINAILLKAKSDKILAERITIDWDNKDKFNEMDRLLQSLNKKDHIIKLTTSKDEAIKSLFESIQNFNKRLQLENDQFVIADTFGLQADEKTTAANLKKLNKIIEFFDSAIESLLPKLIKFLEEYEPEALKKAKEQDDAAKKALENATKIEKQKRPANQMNYSDKSQSRGSQNNQYRGGYNNGMQGNQASPRDRVPSHLEQAHKENIQNIPQLKKSVNDNGGSANKSDKATDKKEIKKSSLEKAVDTLLDYLESNGNSEVGNYMTSINKASNIFKPFGTPINENAKNKDELLKIADQNFAKNTRQAHTYYAELSDSIENIAPQVDEMQKVIVALKASLNEMSSKELEQLSMSVELKNFEKRINSYHAAFKNVQSELKNKHQLHRLQRKDPYEERDYNDLAAKVSSLHGLDKKISEAKSQLESLQKSIKSTMARHKRDENKRQ